MAGNPSNRIGKPMLSPKPSEPVFLIISDGNQLQQLSSELSESGFTVHPYMTAREFLLDNQFDGRWDRHFTGGVVVCDYRLPGMSGGELWRLLKDDQMTIPVILITSAVDSPAVIREAPTDFLMRPVSSEQIHKAISRTMNPETIDEIKLDKAFCSLTYREFSVLEIVAEGKSSRATASELGITTKTVEAHRARIMDKTRADNVSHLIRMFRAWNLDEDLTAS